jgi:hypothetical protein
MSKLYEYEQELIDSIRSYQNEMQEDHAVFEKYAPMIRRMSERAYQLFEAGYRDSMHWSNHGINMADEGLADLHRSMVNRADGARKAAATRKAKKEKV